jgi:hypothetical protein
LPAQDDAAGERLFIAKGCLGCHGASGRGGVGPELARSPLENAAIVYGRREISSADCHGTDHNAIMASRGRVAETVCATCHAQIYKEHVLDVGIRTDRDRPASAPTGAEVRGRQQPHVP